MTDRHLVLWYVPSDTFPTVTDAIGRLDYLRIHGETPFAFSFRKKFSAEEALDFRRTGDES